MNEKFKTLTSEVERLRTELKRAEDTLQGKRAACIHTWDDPKYTPDVREAYRTGGDEVGTLGIDWQGPENVPRRETPKWTRTCLRCGRQGVTTQTTEQVSRTPKFA